MINLVFENWTDEKIPKKIFDDFFEKSIKKLGAKKSGSIHLTLVSDKKICELNKLHRGIDLPTDVISLSYMEGESFPGEDLLGEIFISVDTAKKQSHEDGKSLESELQFLFVHGLLHVFNYDHMNKKDRVEMFRLQDEILNL